MDAEAIVKAMEEAGLNVFEYTTPTDNLLSVDATGMVEQWTRFRGVPLAEVEKALYKALRAAVTTPARVYDIGVAAQIMAGFKDRLRGGNT